MLLELDRLTAGYGGKTVLDGVTLQVGTGEIVALFGPNGAGKSTTLKAIFGQLTPRGGQVRYEGRDITRHRPAENVRDGIAYVIQGGRVFTRLAVDENLMLGGFSLGTAALKRQRLEQVYAFFPELAERRRQRAGTLSGGERQMVALGMSLMLQPRLWLLDEPSIGLAPILVTKVLEKVKAISLALGTTVMLVEQKARQALTVADRVYVMKVGRVVDEGPPSDYASRAALRAIYMPDEEKRLAPTPDRPGARAHTG